MPSSTLTVLVAAPTALETFALSEVRIAPYRGGRRAAASYTFDDGPASTSAIASMFETYGMRASFYLVPAWMNEARWLVARGLQERGHEVGNHSMNHIALDDSSLSDAEIVDEIESSQCLFEEKLGVKPQVFVFPFGRSSSRTIAVALRSHLATRSEGPFLGADHQVRGINETSSSASFNSALDRAISSSAWFVGAGHGMDGDGYRPMTSQFLSEHLSYVRGKGSEVWVDTFQNVAMYRLARERLRPVAVAHGAGAVVHLEGEPGSALATVPLTVEVPLLRVDLAFRAKLQTGVEIPVHVSAGMLRIDLHPGEHAKLEW